MKRYVVSAAARSDMIEIWNYLAQFSIRAADQAIGGVEEAFNRIGAHPELGHQRLDLAPGRFRFLTSGGVTIVYLIDREPLLILRVARKGRDIEGLLNAP